MTEAINYVEVEGLGKFPLGGGGGSQPAPDSVNSETIQDHTVKEEDLDQDVLDKINTLEGAGEVTEEELSDEWQQAMANAMQNGGGSPVVADAEEVSEEELSDEWQQAMANATNGSGDQE